MLFRMRVANALPVLRLPARFFDKELGELRDGHRA